MQKEMSERLLDAWMDLSVSARNRKLVDELSLNETMVCRLLYQKEQLDPDHYLTATDLCNGMDLLKSQMNLIISHMEKDGLVQKRQSQRDRRSYELELCEKGRRIYLEQHGRMIELVDQIIRSIGREEIEQFIPVFEKTAKVVEQYRQSREEKDHD